MKFSNLSLRPSSPQTKLPLESPNSKGSSSPAGSGGFVIGLTGFGGASAGTSTPDSGSAATPTSPTTEPSTDDDTLSKLALGTSVKSEPGQVTHILGHHRSSSEPPILKKLNGQPSGQLSEASGYGSMTTQSTSSSRYEDWFQTLAFQTLRLKIIPVLVGCNYRLFIFKLRFSSIDRATNKYSRSRVDAGNVVDQIINRYNLGIPASIND